MSSVLLLSDRFLSALLISSFSTRHKLHPLVVFWYAVTLLRTDHLLLKSMFFPWLCGWQSCCGWQRLKAGADKVNTMTPSPGNLQEAKAYLHVLGLFQ